MGHIIFSMVNDGPEENWSVFLGVTRVNHEMKVMIAMESMAALGLLHCGTSGVSTMASPKRTRHSGHQRDFLPHLWQNL